MDIEPLTPDIIPDNISEKGKKFFDIMIKAEQNQVTHIDNLIFVNDLPPFKVDMRLFLNKVLNNCIIKSNPKLRKRTIRLFLED